LKNCGFSLPQKRVTVNLAPADLKKEGATFELPIALGVLTAAELLPQAAVAPWLFGGELSLDGTLKPIRGVLPLALAARDGGFKGVLVPAANAAEAALVDKIEVIPVDTVLQAMLHLSGDEPIAPYDRLAKREFETSNGAHPIDMKDVRGQAELKSALEVAAAGGHNVLMSGPPGSGKTMLARRLPSIMPAMTFEEALEVTKVYSVLGLLHDGEGLVRARPFRSPHHTISDAGLVGGGAQTRPGELSMAHRGVLFLDELPEFRRNVLEVLRQPLEEGVIRLARANVHVTYQCQVMLVAAMNPCPCGYFRVADRTCNCPQTRVAEYHARVSGPLLDRVDITLQTRAVDVESIVRLDLEEKPSQWYRDRVEAARARQRERFQFERGVYCNAQMTPQLLARFAQVSEAARRHLKRAVDNFGLLARAHDRILKVARTRADLLGHERVEDADVAFAIGCRVLDRRDWLSGGQSRRSAMA
jgi:magnesium chelatase family protein